MREDETQSILKAMIKRAVGYRAEESVEEYGTDAEGSLTLVKKRVTEKEVPGDVSAARLLLELDGGKSTDGEFASLGDEQLLALRAELVKQLENIL